LGLKLRKNELSKTRNPNFIDFLKGFSLRI
jgi:hypothetical protein